MSSNLAISLVIGASVGAAVSGINQIKSSLSALKDSSMTISQRLGKLSDLSVAGMKSSIGSLTALGSSITALATPAIQFESAMADVKKVVNFETPQQFKEMNQDILKLTRTIPMAGEEIAAIVAAGGQAGIARENLLGYAEDAAKMGVAFDMAAGDAGTAMATMANVLGKPISEMARFGDAINYLSDNANSKASDIVNVMARAGSDTRMLGLTENQAAALGSTFLSMGKAPELAAQAIKGMSSAFAELKAGKHADELKMLGLTPKSFAKAMNKDAQGAISDFIARVKQLPKDKQYPILAKMFGKQYADDVMLLAQNTGEYNRQLQLLQETDENGNLKYIGSMQREFENRSATTENNLKLLKNSFSELGISIGQYVLPVINNFVDWLKPVVLSVTEWINTNSELMTTIAKWGTYIIGGIAGFSAIVGVFSVLTFATLKVISVLQVLWSVVSFGGSVLSGLGKILFTVSGGALKLVWGGVMKLLYGFGYLIGTIGKVALFAFNLGKVLVGTLFKGLMLAGKAILFIGRALLMNPIGLLVTGIAVAAFVIYRYWEPIKGFFTRLWENVKLIFANVCQFVSNIWNGITGIWSAVWNGITSWFSGLWTNLQSLFSGNFSALGNIILAFNPLNLFQTVFSTVLSWFGIDLPNTFSGFGQNIIDGLVNGISNAWNLAKEKVTELGSGIKNWFAEKLGIHSPSRVFMGFGQNTVEGLAIGMEKSLPLAEQSSKSLSSAVTFEPVLNTVETIAKPLLGEKKGFFGSLWDDISFGANLVGSLFGMGQNNDVRTPNFNPNAQAEPYQSLQNTYQERQQANSQGGITVHFNPTININGNQSQGVMEQVQQGLSMSLVEFERLLNRVLDQRQRRAY